MTIQTSQYSSGTNRVPAHSEPPFGGGGGGGDQRRFSSGYSTRLASVLKKSCSV